MREGGNTVNENTFNWNLNNSRCFSSNFQNPSDRKESFPVYCTWIYCIDHVDSVLHDVRYGNTYNQ